MIANKIMILFGHMFNSVELQPSEVQQCTIPAFDASAVLASYPQKEFDLEFRHPYKVSPPLLGTRLFFQKRKNKLFVFKKKIS